MSDDELWDLFEETQYEKSTRAALRAIYEAGKRDAQP